MDIDKSTLVAMAESIQDADKRRKFLDIINEKAVNELTCVGHAGKKNTVIGIQLATGRWDSLENHQLLSTRRRADDQMGYQCACGHDSLADGSDTSLFTVTKYTGK